MCHAARVTDASARDSGDLRVADLLTFLAVVRSSSLTAAARERRVTPSQVSKAITRVEAHFGRKLIERGSRGVLLSEAGRVLAPTLEAIVAQLETARAASPEGAEMTLGAPSYLQSTLLPILGQAAPNVRIRAFELPPSLLRANAQDDGFDILLVPGGADHLPPSWTAEKVGELRRGLFASPVLAAKLGKKPLPLATVCEIPFVMPIFRQQGRVVPVDDDFPVPRSQRRVGHQVQTFIVGLELAAQTEQLAFGPAIAAHRHVASGALVEIPIEGYQGTDTLTFACNVDRVSARLRTAFTTALKAWMNDLAR
ncbi:MAG: Transcriptional regulator, LysR family [Labilithrix sp.]|nr:Transcriptional regulator, LysR family [Labilithrix sp.]